MTPGEQLRGMFILLLANRFLEHLQPDGIRVSSFSNDVADCFRNYEWPGNIRELRNVIERSVTLARTETVQLTDLPELMQESTASATEFVAVLAEISRAEALDNADHRYLTALLEKHDGNISQAAQQAGLSRQGMHKLLSRHGLNAADFRP